MDIYVGILGLEFRPKLMLKINSIMSWITLELVVAIKLVAFLKSNKLTEKTVVILGKTFSQQR